MGLVKGNIENKTYAYILSDGFIRVKSEEGVEGTVRRDYTTPAGEEGTKFELVFAKLEGIIKRIGFKDVDFGRSIEKFLEVEVENDGDEKPTCLSLNVETSFARDVMQKLPNIDLGKEITIVPYCIEAKGAQKKRSGITIYQDNKKIDKYFYDKVSKKIINGYPDIDWEKVTDKDDRQIYFLSAKKFIIKYIEDNIIPKIKIEEPAAKTPETEDNYNPEDEITIDDVNALIPGEVQNKTIPQPTPTTDVLFHTKTEMLTIITEMAKSKFGSVSPESVKNDVMNATGLAFVDRNLGKIISELDELPNKK